ncbi:uncharacterized protein A4U43_C08F5800 [Asparagus officinalis]|nr:uncharacterized protein A4U43_C08F5800 [Asparagus officinalis]
MDADFTTLAKETRFRGIVETMSEETTRGNLCVGLVLLGSRNLRKSGSWFEVLTCASGGFREEECGGWTDVGRTACTSGPFECGRGIGELFYGGLLVGTGLWRLDTWLSMVDCRRDRVFRVLEAIVLRKYR